MNEYQKLHKQFDYNLDLVKGEFDIKKMSIAGKKRRELVSLYGFAIPCEKALQEMVKLTPLLEVGAGTGYWASLLKERGVDIIATDGYPGSYKFKKEWHKIEKLDANAAIAKYPNRTLCVSWACSDNPWAFDALKTYKGNTFVCVGEGYGGCTADDSFFDELDSNWNHVKYVTIPFWYGLHDIMSIYKRKKEIEA